MAENTLIVNISRELYNTDESPLGLDINNIIFFFAGVVHSEILCFIPLIAINKTLVLNIIFTLFSHEPELFATQMSLKQFFAEKTGKDGFLKGLWLI